MITSKSAEAKTARATEVSHAMQDSRIIEVNGVFLGAAIALPDNQGWRFVAAIKRLERLHGRVVSSLTEAQQMAKWAFLGPT